MDVWTSKSNPGSRILLPAACAVAGLAIATGFLVFITSGAGAVAGFFLGVLLLIIGLAALLASSKQTVVIDPEMRRINIEESHRFRTKKRSILFSEIAGISIAYLGEKSSPVMWYYLVLKLKDGEEYPLFSPSRFFKGISDRFVVACWKQHLEKYLGVQDIAIEVRP